LARTELVAVYYQHAHTRSRKFAGHCQTCEGGAADENVAVAPAIGPGELRALGHSCRHLPQ
jgi:hypothetical protein